MAQVGMEPNIMFRTSYYESINQAYLQAGVIPNVAMYLDNVEASKKMVLRGLGITFLPKSYVEQDLQDRTLVEVPIKENIKIEYELAVTHRRGKESDGVVKAFLEVLHSLHEF